MRFMSSYSDERVARAGIRYLCLSTPISGLLGRVYAIYVLVIR